MVNSNAAANFMSLRPGASSGAAASLQAILGGGQKMISLAVFLESSLGKKALLHTRLGWNMCTGEIAIFGRATSDITVELCKVAKHCQLFTEKAVLSGTHFLGTPAPFPQNKGRWRRTTQRGNRGSRRQSRARSASAVIFPLPGHEKKGRRPAWG